VVVLSELEELPNSEIADILGLSVGVVKIRLHRGRSRLLDELRRTARLRLVVRKSVLRSNLSPIRVTKKLDTDQSRFTG
jgi:hypothetical protein